ncbi:3' terminal RNA ribose 2'-O-methyltransferase Hen1 [Kitasatospora purpeofusca]|uniref:3' terminal RNA ribose 2'-O-methyltransferase Hen1 n=1 Tax=Kitasatospora purpeofusca TaxID=67352 RepID=UPI0022558C4E|nr:3' terminal RNA ribose 2'-O-methyltransferase Hen1 [Kitasatospora purpeofusca]MCX4752790.1 3' terminal RNA ribose 2'-O-methyltransferase Hen1 [Kitasatospora purpeofusca]WSR32345.1 3' terminal RNA ribose 2'-O-methyltransferase Hen1 [Kitasatospora purpeofusca]
MSISTTGATGATGLAGETGPTGPAGPPGRPATDLARLLHRRPDTVHRVATAFGEAHVFFPDADAERCTAVLLAEPDPEAPVRGRRGKGRPPAVPDAHVGDRPYAASSVFAAVLRTVFRQPLGQSLATPDPADPDGDEALPLEIELPVVRADREPEPAPGGVDGAVLARRLFEPLGWRVEAAVLPLDAEAVPGGSPYLRLRLSAPAVRPAEALRHLSALLPVLDGAAHHWVPPERADADGLLAVHPERAVIARRLARHGHAVAWGEDDESDRDGAASVRAALGTVGAGRVVHLGCGHGGLLAGLLGDGGFTELLGVDVSPAALAAAARRLGLERTADPAPEWELRSGAGRPRVRLVQGAPVYADARLTGFDAMVFEAPAVAPAAAPAVTGTTDRVTPAAHPAYLEHAVFGAARPPAAVATAPPGADGAAFAAWARRTAAAHGYAVTLPSVSRPPLLALFERAAPAPGGGGPR